jgi:hypothetical protein
MQIKYDDDDDDSDENDNEHHHQQHNNHHNPHAQEFIPSFISLYPSTLIIHTYFELLVI